LAWFIALSLNCIINTIGSLVAKRSLAVPELDYLPVSLLLICHSYPPVLGGSEIEAQRVAAALRQRGHQVTVLCAGGDPMPPVTRWVDPLGTPVRIFGGRWREPLRSYAFALGVAWTLLTGRYQLVYFLMQGLHLAAGLPVARLLHKPVLMKVSGSSIITMMGQSWLGRLELRWLRKWAKRVMILNKGMAEEAYAAGFGPEHLFWMPNPVDVEQFAPGTPDQRVNFRREMAIPQDAQVVLFVGRLAPEKEIPSLLKAMALVAKQLPSALLVVIGDGPDRQKLEDQTRELGITDNVLFAGRCPPEKVQEWLKASDVFPLVSSNEGFSCSLLEAMSTGLPSIVSDIPANTQLIEEGVHGLITALCDEQAIAHALLRLLPDAPLRHTIGTAARQRVVDNYSMDKVIDLYESLFMEALGKTK
jgi:glycosyltransferase involved in cell wall biosynthesis